jgi:hypothetical protein
MSDRASSDFRLALGVVLGPIIALLNQQAIYSGATWACGHAARGTLHLIPALCLFSVAILALDSSSLWRRAGERAFPRRTQFLALVAVSMSVFSAIVILAQWAGIFTFGACMKA